jgi:hypothetical protein
MGLTTMTAPKAIRYAGIGAGYGMSYVLEKLIGG